MVAAAWQHPPAGGVTFQHLSDSHIATGIGVSTWARPRLDNIAADMAESGALASVAARIHTGDITEHGADSEVADALDWINRYWSGPTDILVYGNHDFGNAWVTYSKTRAQVEADYGRSGLTDTYFGEGSSRARVLGFCTDSDPGGNAWTISTATLNWLDSKLQQDSTTPVVLACHYAMEEMAGVPVGAQTQPASAFVDMLSSYPQILLWSCGHYHYEVTDPNCVSSLAVGNRTAFPHICGPSTAHTRGTPDYNYDAQHPYRSLFLTILGEDRVEVRYRDHGARQWVAGENGEQVTVLTPA